MKFLGQSNTSWDRKVITVLCTDNYPKAMLNFFLHLIVCIALSTSLASLVAQMVKNPPAVQETWVPSLDQEDPLEKRMATYSSTLAWRIPWPEDPGRLQSMGLQRVRHDWVTNTFTIFHQFSSLTSYNYAMKNCYYLFISCKSRVPNEPSHVLAELWWVLWEEDSNWKCLCEKFSGQCSQELCQLGMNRDRTRQEEKLSCSEIVIKASGCSMEGTLELTWHPQMSLTEPVWQTYEPLHQPATGCGLPQRGHVILGKTLRWQQFSRWVSTMSHQLSVLW